MHMSTKRTRRRKHANLQSKNYQELSRKAANLIAAQVILKPDSVLGLATGSSPVGTYEHLVEMYENGDLDFLR